MTGSGGRVGPGTVAGVLHRRDEFRQFDGRRVDQNPGALGRGLHLHLGHTRHLAQGVFDGDGARGAVHARQAQADAPQAAAHGDFDHALLKQIGVVEARLLGRREHGSGRSADFSHDVVHELAATVAVADAS